MPSTKWMVCEAISEDIGSLRLKERELPPPGPGEATLRLRACSVNFPDILMVQGKYQHKPDLPFAPGVEAAGDIVELEPEVEGWKVGDAVVARMRSGGFAEAVNVPAAGLEPLPTGYSYAEGAAYPMIYLTAYVALVVRGQLQAGEVLLVHGSAGGVGMAAVEIGKLVGATVIATGGSDAKLDVVRSRGADHIINYQQADGKLGGFRERVKELTGGRGADVIYDPVGGDVFDESIRCIAWNGRLLVIGFTSGRIPSVPANMPLIKGFSVVGVRGGEYGRRDPEAGAEHRATLHNWASEGTIRPHICATFPLEEAVAAMRMLENREAVGKVVVTMNGSELS